MAYYLLKGNIVQFVKELTHLKDLGYQEMPRHYQEAFLIYILNLKNSNLPILKEYKIHENIVTRFNHFYSVLKKYKGNKELAKNELFNNYSDTYWYYFLYNKSEGPIE